MAEFKIHELEGIRYVEIHLNHESVRVEAGALSYYQGDITIHSKLMPSLGGMVKSLLADEAVYRPLYAGTGIITLESSLGGFHVLPLAGESWILERGAYWASDGGIEVDYHREKMQASVWAGEGPIYLQTRVRGEGSVVLTTRGPIEVIELQPGQQVVAEGKYVVARTGDVKFSVQRSTKNFLGRFTAGEGLVRVFEGSGKVLLNPAPYWRYRVFTEKSGGMDSLPSRATS